MKQYLEMINHVFKNGDTKADRTKTGTLSVFGHQERFDLRKGFPLQTTKKLHLKSIIHELLWFLKGDTNVKYLNDNGVKIWNEWANNNGELGPVYGRQWRKWPVVERMGSGTNVYSIDQIKSAIEMLKNNPDDRGIIVNAWNVGQLNKMALRPCHTMFQFYSVEIEGKRYLDLQLYQRSADLFIGVPFNIASYALLLMMVAKITGMTPRYFVHTFGDLHIYSNHVEQCKELLERKPKKLPKMLIHGEQASIDDFEFEDFELKGYSSHPHIAGKVAV